MDMQSLINLLLGLVITGFAWFMRDNNEEQKRLGILINKTREEYATREDVRSDMRQVMDALHRVEDKLDKVLQRD